MKCDLSKVKELLSVPEQFILMSRQFPEQVDEALSVFDGDPEGVRQLLEQTDAIEHYARRIKIDTEAISNIAYGKLKIVAKLGELMPRGKGGRGKKNLTGTPSGLFNKDTVKTYRKVSENSSKLEEYRREVLEAIHGDDPNPPEISMSGFIRYVASDGNLKAHQNKGVVEWYTPAEYIDAARNVMGSIDVDPASNKIAQRIVKAGKFFTKDNCGLKKQWNGNIYMNPPFKADLIKAFISKLCESFQSGVTTQAIVLTNNSTDTKWWHEAASASSAICFTRGRVAFYSPAGETAAPTNGHTIFYMGGKDADFQAEFEKFGCILRSM